MNQYEAREVYTFSQLKVRDRELKQFMNKNLYTPVTRYLRMVYCKSMIPRIEVLLFQHCGVYLYYNSCYKEKVLIL